MEIRLIKNHEIKPCADMISNSIKSMNGFYPPKIIDASINHFNADVLEKKINNHFYVAVEGERIVGCGGVDRKKDDESCGVIFCFFVDPEHQRQGIGRQLLKKLEDEEVVSNCTKILVPSSISAIPFYRKCGYEHINENLNFERTKFWLEKRIKK